MADLETLQEALGVTLDNPSLLEQALTHSSYMNENPGLAPLSNERLEFLGDAVIGLAVAERLYQDRPDLPEGEMTQLRSALVRRETLAKVATTIRLGSYLLLGKGEEGSRGRSKMANLAAVFEAVVGAVFLDQGYSVTREVTLRLLQSEFERTYGEAAATDYKSRLQEIVQARQQPAPTYRLVKSTGPDHDKVFTVAVVVEGDVVASGTGKSKKLAEADAARAALDQLSG